MSRDESLYLADIQECCEKVLKYTAGYTLKDLIHDDRTFDAILRNLEIIGEAVKHVSDETQARYPAVKWRKIGDFRNIVAHEYFGVSDEIVWDVIENEIPPLLRQTKTILAEKLARE
ncbi:MAG: DUF86 domain-containing protein [Chloroflexi bacterium]|nr:MAG: DUF86 domain-containing protein [Chloroflexota bacterium]